MKSANPELIAFLASGRKMAMADLYTVTLRSGTVKRYTQADIPITWDGVTYQPLRISRGTTKSSIGVRVDSLDVRILADENDQIDGQPLIPFAMSGGFDGGTILVERLFGPDWGSPVGTLVMFAGRFGPIRDASRTGLGLTVNSWIELLNINMPRNLYQTACLHALYDEGCGVDRNAFAVTGAVEAGSNTSIKFDTDVSEASGYLDQGVIIFDNGPDAGIKKTIKSQVGGIINLISSLSDIPDVGYTFTAYPGCDHTQATCLAKFNNLLRFRGFPYIPVPETSV